MEILPQEIFVKIFKENFDLNELIELRNVCKKWKSNVDYILSNSIVVLTKKKYFSSNLFYSKQEYNSINCVNGNFNYSLANKLCFIFNQKKCLNIRKLVIYDVENSFGDFHFINCFFSKVEHLEIIGNFLENNYEKQLIKLDNLKVLKLNFNHKSLIKIDSPKLIILKVKKLDKISLCYPQKIKYLHCHNFNHSIINFINLKILICETVNNYSGGFFRKLNKLTDFYLKTIDKENLNKILKEKNFKFNHIKLFLNGIKINQQMVEGLMKNY